ncbi:MAG: ABC transporter permease [Planctomycetes bacterium]|nr:ABC transporter permease [Planctomycetota bacterium]
MNDTPSQVSARRYWPLGQLVLARLREFWREPEAVFWVYGFPVLMTVVLGIAFRNKPVERVHVDVAEGPGAPSVKEMLKNDKEERFEAEIHDVDSCRQRLRTGKVELVVVPASSAEGSSTGKGSQRRYEYLFVPGRPESRLARSEVDSLLQDKAGRKDAAEVKEEKVDEPGGRYIDFLVPGLLGMGLMGGGLWGVGFVTVDMRIRKLLKRFLATPMRRADFLAALMISRLIFMVPEVLILLVFARLAFGVTIAGSLVAVVVLILLGAVSFAGIGLLVASRARTIEAVSGLMNLIMLPMWLFSGVFFSSERFPDWLQGFIWVLPLTPLNNALRAVMLDGMSLASQWAEMALLAGWGLVTFVLALRWFRWR